MSIGFARNFTFLDLIQDPITKMWLYLGPGVSTIDDDSDDETDDTSYYDSKGAQPEDVIGTKIAYAVSGHRYFGDPAQDLICSLKYVIGDERVLNFRRIAPDGSMIEGPVTVTAIKDGGGDANEKGTFECTLTFREMPTYVPPKSKVMPSSISFEEQLQVAENGTLDLSKKIKVEPDGATPNCVFALSDESMDVEAEGGTATIDAAGVLHATKQGKVSITAKAVSKPSITASAEITIQASEAV